MAYRYLWRVCPFQVIFTGGESNAQGDYGDAIQPECTHSGCNIHCCGELDQRALLAVAVALLAVGDESQSRSRKGLRTIAEWD